jgi:hypothetical protein
MDTLARCVWTHKAVVYAHGVSYRWAMYGQSRRITPVPNPENFTPIRSIRIASATWDRARSLAREQGKTMSELIRELLDWWLRTPGAKLPARPTETPKDN